MRIGTGIGITRQRRSGPPMPVLALDFGAGTFALGAQAFPSLAAYITDTPATFARAGANYYVDAAGAMTSVASGTPRTGTRGLLLEPAATSLKRRSQDINLDWSAAGATVTANAANAPDGTTTAERIATVNPWEGVIDYGGPASLTSGQTYTFAVHQKNESGTNTITLGVYGLTGGDRTLYLDLGAGVATAVTFPEMTGWGREPLANGWERIWLTFVSPETTAAANCFIYSGSSGARSFLLWGVNLIDGALSSYVPTTTGTASRAADVLTLDMPLGTSNLYVTYDDDSVQVIPATSGLFAIPAGTLQRRYVKRLSNAEVLPVLAAPFADSVPEGFGLNTHLQWAGDYDTEYADYVPRLTELGVRYLRDTVDLGAAAPWIARAQAMADLGIKFSYITGTATTAADKAKLDALPISSFWAVEGTNEPSTGNGALAATRITEMRAALNGDARYAGIPVLGPSYISAPEIAAAGTLGTTINYVNSHPYPGGSIPESGYLLATLDRDDDVKVGGPWVVSETGWHDNKDAVGFIGVSAAADAIYAPRQLITLLTHPTRTIHKVFFHELLDFSSRSPTGPEGYFGFLTSTSAPKAKFNAMKALLGTLKDTGTPASGGIQAALSGANPNVRMRAFRRSTGAYDLVVWNAVSVYDPATKLDLTVADVTETIRFASSWGSAQVLRVNDPTPSFAALTITNRSVTLPVRPGVAIVRLTA